MAPARQTESAPRKHRQTKADMDHLVYGMDREIKGRPEMMMAELEELSRPKRKPTKPLGDPEHDSYRALLRINESFDYNDVPPRRDKMRSEDDWSMEVQVDGGGQAGPRL